MAWAATLVQRGRRMKKKGEKEEKERKNTSFSLAVQSKLFHDTKSQIVFPSWT